MPFHPLRQFLPYLPILVYPCALVITIHSCAFAVVLHSCTFGVVFLIVLIFVIVLIVLQCRILIVVYMRYVDLQILYLLFQGFHLPFQSCDIPVVFVERFVRFVIWKISFTVAPALFSKISPLLCFLAKTISATCFITIVGVGTSVNCPRVILFPERSEKKLYVPCRFPVGPRHIAPCVLSSSVFLTFLSSCTCA